LGDIYGLEARCSRSASETYALTVVRCLDSVPFPHRDARLAVLNGLIRAVLMPDDTPARLGPNTAAALVRRRTGLPTTLRMLRAELDRRQTAGHLPATQMWLEALPSDISDLPNLLRQFRR
jgi:hypothetical protein